MQQLTHIWKVLHQILQGFTNIKLCGHCRENHFRGQEVNIKVRYEQQRLKIV